VERHRPRELLVRRSRRRHRRRRAESDATPPAGAAERLVQEHPAAAVFADSPAFDAIRLVESRFPAVESAGIIDHRRARPAHDIEPYRPYAAAVDATAEYDDEPGDDHHQ